MKLEKYGYTLNISEVQSKNELLAMLAKALDEMDITADIDWARVQIETDVDYLEEPTLYPSTFAHTYEYRTLRIRALGSPVDLPDEVGPEA